MNISQNPTEQISAAIPCHVFMALEKASEIQGESLNHFLIQAAYEKARQIIEQNRIIKLSAIEKTENDNQEADISLFDDLIGAVNVRTDGSEKHDQYLAEIIK